MSHVTNGAALALALVDHTFFIVSFICLRVVLLEVAFGLHLPAHVVSRFDGFEPSRFNRVSTDSVHPFDGLLWDGRNVDRKHVNDFTLLHNC